MLNLVLMVNGGQRIEGEGMNDLRYRDLEAALASAEGVADAEMPAFRAELRHFRNLGVPNVPRVGTGTQLSYTWEHLCQAWLAIELHKDGNAPATIAAFVKRYWDKSRSPYHLAEAFASQREVVLVIRGSGESVAGKTTALLLQCHFYAEDAADWLRKELRDDDGSQALIKLLPLGPRLRRLRQSLEDALKLREYFGDRDGGNAQASNVRRSRQARPVRK
jgi:hypothetical protein